MTYQIFPVSYDPNSVAVTFPATFQYMLFSVWVQKSAAGPVFFLNDSSTSSKGFFIDLVQNGGLANRITYLNGATSGEVFFSFPTTFTVGEWINILLSIDTVGRVFQLYVNDVAQTVNSTSFVGAATAISGNSLAIDASVQSGSCLADLYIDAPNSFYDLTITSNRRKFITLDGFPVDLGTDGSTPTGAQPPLFLSQQSGQVPADFKTNRGSGGGTFTNAIAACASGAWPSIVPPNAVNIADLWFRPTGGFVDLSKPENRLLFVSENGCTVRLGSNGQLPFGQPASVFFSRANSQANSFATNRGLGGGFDLSNGDLAIDLDHPCGSSQLSPITSDFLPLTSDGGPSVWLRYSNDRGHTWGNPVARSLGPSGAYGVNLQWRQLGLARDRVYEVYWTGQEVTVLNGAFLDVDKAQT